MHTGRCLGALSLRSRALHFVPFVLSFVRLHFVTTGTRPSDSPRVIINIDRASRDLAYFFYHLPVDRISWAFPYVPPGLYTQLVISRSRELQASSLDPVEWSLAARFSYLHRPPMGRVNPQPQATGAAASSSAAAQATAPAGDPQDQEAPASPEGVVGTALSVETTDQEFGEASVQEPPLTPRVASGISSSQPTFTPLGSETAGAEEVDDLQQEEPVAEPTTIELPPETNTLGALNDETPLIEAELQTGTAASRGEVSSAQDDSLGPHNAEEPPFDAFSLLGPPKIEPTTKEEVEEEVYADPSASPVGLPPLHTHNHPTQFESLATDPVFDEAEVDFGDEEPDVDPDDQAEPTAKQEQQEADVADEETAPSAEASQTASAAVDPQPKRTRGARGGQKHQFEQSDEKYAITCDLIASHLASHTYRRVGKTYHLPFVKPLLARKDYYYYSEWYKYVVFHADAWAESREEGDISDGALKAWAAIIPEFWSWCARNMPDISNGVKQPPGYYQKTYKFIPLRQVRSSAATSSQAAPPAQQAFPVTVPARAFQPVVGASAASSSGGWRPQLRPVDRRVQPRSQTPQGNPRSRSQTRTSESVRPPRPTRPCPRPNPEIAESLADTEQPTRTVHLADTSEQADDPMDGVGPAEEGVPNPILDIQMERRRRAQSNRTTRAEPRLRGRRRKLSSQIRWSRLKARIWRRFALVQPTP